MNYGALIVLIAVVLLGTIVYLDHFHDNRKKNRNK